MHRPALSVSKCPVHRSRAFRGAFAMGFIASAFVGLSGCGSGVGTSASPQSTVVPVASAKGPQLGYIWLTSDNTLRPVLGIPGASIVGQSVVPAGAYANAVTSASAGIALLQGTDGSFDLMRLPSGQPVSLNLRLPVGAILRISPSGTTALVYTPGAASASLITGLKSTPAIQTVVAPSAISDAAVSDTGTVGLEYVQGSGTAVALLAAGGRAVPVTAIGSGGGIAFVPGSATSTATGISDLLIADASANALTLVHSAGGALSSQSIPAAGLLNAPVAVGVSQSGHWALVANRGSKTMVRVDLRTFVAVQISCACQPTLAEPLADDGAFRVTSLTSGPNWIVDAAAATPRTLFLPPIPAASATANLATAVRP